MARRRFAVERCAREGVALVVRVRCGGCGGEMRLAIPDREEAAGSRDLRCGCGEGALLLYRWDAASGWREFATFETPPSRFN